MRLQWYGPRIMPYGPKPSVARAQQRPVRRSPRVAASPPAREASAPVTASGGRRPSRFGIALTALAGLVRRAQRGR